MGCGISRSRRRQCSVAARARASSSAGRLELSKKSFMSMPAQKLPPMPWNTSTRTAASACDISSASSMASVSSTPMALRLAARSSPMLRMPPAWLSMRSMRSASQARLALARQEALDAGGARRRPAGLQRLQFGDLGGVEVEDGVPRHRADLAQRVLGQAQRQRILGGEVARQRVGLAPEVGRGEAERDEATALGFVRVDGFTGEKEATVVGGEDDV